MTSQLLPLAIDLFATAAEADPSAFREEWAALPVPVPRWRRALDRAIFGDLPPPQRDRRDPVFGED